MERFRAKAFRSLLLVSAFLFTCACGFTQEERPAASVPVATPAPKTFTNPLLPVGPDPWVLTYDGFYYYMNTTGKNLTLWKTHDITDLRNAEKKVIWTPEPGNAWSKAIWAPEIHRWDGKWYVYFAADENKNDSHRVFVIENASADPMVGEWTFRGQVKDATDHWAIDADLFELNGQHYMLWSGWKGDTNGEQDIFIAHMSNPWTIDSPRTLISAPTFSWETIDGRAHEQQVKVNEGPEALIHGDKVFVVYSGSGCWTPNYELGAVEASSTSNLLDAKSWTKIDHPLFRQDPSAGVFGPGHNGFFKSMDGKEDWIIYHANPSAADGCGNKRSPRIQRFTWNVDGTPNFGTPAPVDTPLTKPSE